MVSETSQDDEWGDAVPRDKRVGAERRAAAAALASDKGRVSPLAWGPTIRAHTHTHGRRQSRSSKFQGRLTLRVRRKARKNWPLFK